MSFSVVQSAMASMKANRNLLSKKGKLKNTLTSSNIEKVQFKVKDASKKQLQIIKEKIQKENRQIRNKQLIILSIIMLIIISIIVFYI
jgi:hypothetical protein